MLLVVFVKEQFYNTGCTTSLLSSYTRNEHNSIKSHLCHTAFNWFKELGILRRVAHHDVCISHVSSESTD